MPHRLLEWMRKNGVPITREKYIALNWGETPDPWTAEHEAELPEELRETAEEESK